MPDHRDGWCEIYFLAPLSFQDFRYDENAGECTAQRDAGQIPENLTGSIREIHQNESVKSSSLYGIVIERYI